MNSQNIYTIDTLSVMCIWNGINAKFNTFYTFKFNPNIELAVSLLNSLISKNKALTRRKKSIKLFKQKKVF